MHSCQPVVNPYEGVDLSHVLARNVSCQTARRVARGAHLKAIGLTPPPSGIRHFTWHGWRVTGNIRGSVDRYLATQPGGRRVRWRF